MKLRASNRSLLRRFSYQRFAVNAAAIKRRPKFKVPRSKTGSRVDPTRTITLRRSFGVKLKKQFAKLKLAIVKLVRDQNVFGLTANVQPIAIVPQPTVNCSCSHILNVPDIRQHDHYSCILPDQIIRGQIIGGSKAWYSGEAIKIRTASGALLSVTANHPVMTMEGPVPASQLKEGKNLLRYVGEDDTAASRDDEQYAPVTAEKVFSTLTDISSIVPSTVEVSTTAFDFHGDAKFFKGKVQVVGSYRQLSSNVVAQTAKNLSKRNLIGSGSAQRALQGNSLFEDSTFGPGLAFDSGMGGSSLCCSFGFRHSRPDSATGCGQGGSYSGPAHSQQSVLPRVSDPHARILEKYRDSSRVDTEVLGELLDGCPGQVTLDEIAEVRHFHYSGWVYDFESPLGFIIANSLCILNCGAAATMCVGRYFGVGPATLPEWKKALGTSEKESTHPEAISAYLQSLGLSVQARHGMSLDDLDQLTKRGCPVIVCVQDYGPEVPKGAKFAYGHYLTVIGIDRNLGFVFCQDSSEDNVIADSGSAQVRGRIMVSLADWDQLWHDEDVNHKPYIHFGIAVSNNPIALIPDKPEGVPGDAIWHEDYPGGPSCWMAQDGTAYKCWNPEIIENTFCPTGEGGGIDPSCSPGVSEGMHWKDATKHLKPLNQRARRYLGKLLTEAHVSTKGVHVAVLKNALPQAFGYRKDEARVNLPHVLFTDPELRKDQLGRTWRHELQHARDIVDGRDDLTREQMEKRARAAERVTTRFTFNALTVNAGDWEFKTTSEQVELFKRWLAQQLQSYVQSHTDEELWQKYIAEGFAKGAGRAFDDYQAKIKALSEGDQQKMDFYEGTRAEFLRSSFAQPEAIDKVKLLAGRAFDDLAGITTDMSLRISRALTDGLVQGQNPRQIARDLAEQVDLGAKRALVIARTEMIRAHAEGALTAFENLGVEEVGVMVEWSTSGLPNVCERCEDLEGVVLTIDEMRGMIPLHPNCACSPIPANVGESREGQTRGKGALEGIMEAVGAVTGVPIAKKRPKSILD